MGPTDEESFDNPAGAPIFPGLPSAAYESVLDFGCGCGRLARQLIQQRPRPTRYLGLDLHAGMIQWCREHLASRAPGFEFRHHDSYHIAFNPRGQRAPIALPVPDGSVTFLLAWSVFTHINEAHASFYLREAARVLHPDGILLSTWFLFDKADFPMMQEFQNALFINDVDLANAVIFDRAWLRETARRAGLLLVGIDPPGLRGYQWIVRMQHSRPGIAEVEFPPDLAPHGVMRAPLMPPDAENTAMPDRGASTPSG